MKTLGLLLLLFALGCAPTAPTAPEKSPSNPAPTDSNATAAADTASLTGPMTAAL